MTKFRIMEAESSRNTVFKLGRFVTQRVRSGLKGRFVVKVESVGNVQELRAAAILDMGNQDVNRVLFVPQNGYYWLCMLGRRHDMQLEVLQSYHEFERTAKAHEESRVNRPGRFREWEIK